MQIRIGNGLSDGQEKQLKLEPRGRGSSPLLGQLSCKSLVIGDPGNQLECLNMCVLGCSFFIVPGEGVPSGMVDKHM